MLHLLLADTVSQDGFNLLQYGVAGAALGAVLAVVVRPLLANSIKQQDRALDLLERSVTSNTEAVALFRQTQNEMMQQHTQNAALQARMLQLVEGLECRAGMRHTGPA